MSGPSAAAIAAQKTPLRIRVKEWGEAADVWTKVMARLGFVGIGLFSGSAALSILEKAFG